MPLHSAAQRQASALNGQKSRGPITEEGKRVSSSNALKHGLTAEFLSFDQDWNEQAGDFLNKIRNHYEPQGPVEEQLADTIAAQMWRLRRATVIETRGMEQAIKGREPHLDPMAALAEEMNKFNRIQRYQSAIERSLHKNIEELRKMQAARREGQAEANRLFVELEQMGYTHEQVEREFQRGSVQALHRMHLRRGPFHPAYVHSGDLNAQRPTPNASEKNFETIPPGTCTAEKLRDFPLPGGGEGVPRSGSGGVVKPIPEKELVAA